MAFSVEFPQPKWLSMSLPVSWLWLAKTKATLIGRRSRLQLATFLPRSFLKEASAYASRHTGTHYSIIKQNGIIYAKGRDTIDGGPTLLRLVAPKTALFKHITKSMHNENHSSPVFLQAEAVRRGWYIPTGLKRWKSLTAQCPTCRA